MKIFLQSLILILFYSCNSELPKCDKIDNNFRPHIITHHHKSKVYKYYHITPCSRCISVDDDLKRDKRNTVIYIDNIKNH